MKLIAFLFGIIAFTSSALLAQPGSLDVGDWRYLPVVHEGRVKPLESFARIELQQLGGEGDAVKWLAEALFTPGDAMQRHIIHIDQAELQHALQLDDAPGQLYSFGEITAALGRQRDTLNSIIAKPERERSATEQQLLDLYLHIGEFSEILSSFTFLLPLQVSISPATIEQLGLPQAEILSYADVLQKNPEIDARLKRIIQKKGADVARYSEAERELAKLSFALNNIGVTGANNQLLRVIPTANPAEWVSPWVAFTGGEALSLLASWQDLSAAYRLGNQAGWEQALKNIRPQLPLADEWKWKLESWYHRLYPIVSVAILYTLGLVSLLLGQRYAPVAFYRLASTATWLGITCHMALILARILILSRPPVGTLYESILFVSLVIAALGACLGRRRREAWVVSLFFAALLLYISPLYAPDADPMGVLVAVLNTNFWLATHVICITLGYGVTLLAGSLAHWLLWKPTPALAQTCKRVALLALLFTSLGTLLGGIWADQSWGRFWGWDPKENGALLIVLWLIWILHGRMTPYMQLRGFAALLALANIIVALSWFGVNLLSVGLHSYGFTDSAALGLFSFCALEMLLVGYLYFRARRLHAA